MCGWGRGVKEQGRATDKTNSMDASRGARSFYVLLGCAILVPLAFFLVGASSAWKAAEDEVLLGAERVTDLLHEQALRTFETHSALLAALDHRIAGMSWDEVRTNEGAIRSFAIALNRISLPVLGLALIDPQGRVAMSTFEAHDMPEDLRSSAIAETLRGERQAFIPGPAVRRPNGGLINLVARPRTTDDGTDGGFAVTFYTPSLFEAFYNSLRIEPTDGISLLYDGGQTIARVPETRDPHVRAVEERVVDMMRRTGRATASLRMEEASDRPSTIHVARRIGDYPIYLLYNRALSDLPGQWLLRILPYALLWLTSTVFLVFMTRRAAQATRREREAHASLAVETANSQAKTDAHLRMTRMMDANVFGVVTFSEQGIVQANDAFLRLVGLTQQQFRRDGFVWKDREGQELRINERLLAQLRDRGACPPFETEIVTSETSSVPVLIGATLYDPDPLTWICFVLDLTERREREAQQIFVMRELNHRTKNLLTVIRSVAGQIARTGKGWDDFRERFNTRLAALASSHDLLVESNWRGASLRGLIHSQFSQFHDPDGGQLITRGEDINLSPRAAQAIGMALYELLTNAVKYGALASLDGKVDVSWRIMPGDEPSFELVWKELHGPRVREPDHRGFGHIVIADMTSRSLCGDVSYAFDEDGVSWRLTAPLDQIKDNPDPLSLESAAPRGA